MAGAECARSHPVSASGDPTGGPTGRRVVFVADRLQPRLGMERALTELVWAIVPDVETSVLTIAGRAPSPFPAQVPLVQLGFRPGFRNRVAALRSLRRAVARDGDALYVAVGVWAAVTLLTATIGLRRRIVLWEHSVLPWRLRNEVRVAVAGVCLRLLSWRLTGAVAVSRGTASAIAPLTWPFVTPQVIPNFVTVTDADPPPAAEPGPDGEAVLVGMGSLIPRKNWKLAVAAMAHLPAGYRLKIAGDGPERPALQQQIADLDLTRRVSLLGYVEDTPGLLAESVAVVHPSYAETFGYSLFEAADVARPVITLDRPTMNEFVPDFVCGVRCGQDDPVEFARAVRRATWQRHEFKRAADARREDLSSATTRETWLRTLELFDPERVLARRR
jgi:glycosyltransferase involved in cell wall biosynthesis